MTNSSFIFFNKLFYHFSNSDSSMRENHRMRNTIRSFICRDEVIGAHYKALYWINDIWLLIDRNKSCPQIIFDVADFSIRTVRNFMFSHRKFSQCNISYFTSFLNCKNEIGRKSEATLHLFSSHTCINISILSCQSKYVINLKV